MGHENNGYLNPTPGQGQKVPPAGEIIPPQGGSGTAPPVMPAAHAATEPPDEPEPRPRNPSPEEQRLQAALMVYDVTLKLLLAVTRFVLLPGFCLDQIEAAREAHLWATGEESMIPPTPKAGKDGEACLRSS